MDVARMQAAVIDPGLIEALAETLDVYALYGISRDFERLDETNALRVSDPASRLPLAEAIPPRGTPAGAIANPDQSLSTDALIRRYFDWYIDVDDVGDGRSGVAAFLARYRLLAYAIDTVTDHHRKNIKLACQRVTADWDTIGSAFFPKNTPIKLSQIRTTGNDFHKGGKQVLILSFSLAMTDPPGRVVYKPSSVEIDCRIAGRSAVVNRCKPQGYTQDTSLTELINAYNPPRDRPEGFTSAALPTYTVLPYNCDSVTDAYGYIEFLDRDPVVEGPFAAWDDVARNVADKIATLTATDVQNSDWVVAGSESQQVFYHQLGGLMAMALAVSLCDLHRQNLIVHGKSPCLIDLEEALKHPMSQVAETYLSSHLDDEYDPGGWVPTVFDRGSRLPGADWAPPRVPKPAAFRLYRWTKTSAPGELVSLKGGEDSDGERNRDALMRGLLDGVGSLADPKCNADVQNWVKNLSTTIVRFVPVGTVEYLNVVRGLYRDCCATTIDPLQMTDFEFHEITYDRDATKRFFPAQVVSRRDAWKIRYASQETSGPLSAGWHAPPFFALEHPDHAWRDYLNCDVPSFYHQLGSRQLLNSAGAPINVKDAVAWQSVHALSADDDAPLPAGWQPNDGGAYLPETPIDMVLSQLQWLADDWKDPERRRTYLREALKNMPGAAAYNAIVETMLPPARPKQAARV